MLSNISNSVFRAGPSLVPLFVEAFACGNVDGCNPQDVFLKAVLEHSPETRDSILEGWKAMWQKDKRHLYGTQKNHSGTWAERVVKQVEKIQLHQQKVDAAVRKIVQDEFVRAQQVGLSRWEPLEPIKNNKALLHLVNQKVWGRMANDCCSPPRADDDPQSEAPRYALKLTKISCLEDNDWWGDEIFAVSIAVDGNGKVHAQTTPQYSMDDGDMKYPNHFLYPMADLNGFLDLAFELREDGGYDKTAKAIAALGVGILAVGLKTGNVYVIGAGVALSVIGGLTAVAGWLDDDEHFGSLALS